MCGKRRDKYVFYYIFTYLYTCFYIYITYITSFRIAKQDTLYKRVSQKYVVKLEMGKQQK